ncbi:formamidopyrimidine-DNA glycosylase-like [Triticum urartu]|uniref:DNA-(apurinic or apyrimidinic site) lyase n=1 Tax=Triticum urartu TaxID=4572 RepID=A0A8R7P8Y5_TRIUA|nr:formamidopyrimidine-DNA glycosylase-like [Triticum urartu]XP_048554076.1 formamidopyrimidine-DNA glycosylase-like [Triticum urartu]
MPELPEVEAARLALEEHCVGKRIVRCSAAEDTKVIDGVAPSRLEAALVGRTIAAARRKGKNLWLVLDSPPSPSFQFGMAGAIYIKGVELSKYKRSAVSPTEEWPSKYSKLFVELDDGLEFSFTDKRRFAKIRLLDNPEAVPPISELGPDALCEPMQLDDFVQSFGRKNAPIKSLLLDQSFMSGIGNWMADEVLYQARIHPMQTSSKISKEKCKALHRCIKEVIEKSVEVGADSNEFPENWIFHSREKKPGKAFVDGKKIDFVTVGGRTSAYVPELQMLDGADAAAANRSKKGRDKVEENVGKTSKKGQKAALKEGGKAAQKTDVDEEEEDDKPAKRRAKGAKALPKKVGNTRADDHEEGEDEDEESKPAKRGRKRPAKGPSKKEGCSSDDEDSAGKEETVVAAKRPQRKKR